jgi:hypothetical protein
MAVPVKTWGVDLHPQYQRGISFDRLVGLDYDFGFVKISEGPYRDGTVWTHAEWKSFALAARRTFPVFGAYHFLVNSHPDDHAKGGRVQAELFWRRLQEVGGSKGAVLIVDFEHYSDKYPWLSPYNATLKAYVKRLKELSDGQPVVLYTTESYWQDTGEPSGPVADYDIDFLWEARYPHMEPIDRPQDYFLRHLDTWETPWQGFNGEDTGIIQFTPAGLAAGRYIDCNASKWGLNHIRSLGVKPLLNEDEEHEPVPEDNPHPTNTLMDRVRRVSEYNRRLCGLDIEYWCWDGGNLNIPRPGVGRPASTDGPAPRNPTRGFCADLLSWDLRLLGLPIPKNRFGNENYDGGTRSFRLRYASQMRPFKLSEFREGDVPFVDFQTRWAPEGHIAYCLGDGPEARVAQAHLETTCGVGEPGVNNLYTLRESHDNGYYTHRIPREAIWGAR